MPPISMITAGPAVTRNIEGMMKEEDRKDKFHADFVGQLLGPLAASNTHVAGLGAKDFRNAAAETVGLNQHRAESAHLRFSRSLGEVTQSFGPGCPCLNLTLKDGNLIVEDGMSLLQVMRRLHQSLFE